MQSMGGARLGRNEKLWRYCTADRFEWITQKSCLYFAAANQFADPFEGAVAVQTNLPPADPRYSDMEHTERAFWQLTRLTKLNCWHRSEYESDAMWNLYSDEGKGIAICSTLVRMRKAFEPFRLKPDYGEESLWSGPVEYVDLTQIRMRGRGSLKRFFFKHLAFAWEREFRLAISLTNAEENGVSVPARGVAVPVNLGELIDHIIIGPKISAAQRKRVERIARGAGFEDRLRFSSLLGKPRYI
jgi:hypothetical protein